VDAGLAEILRYNRWANDTLLDACRSLTDQQLDAVTPGTSGTVRVLLMHIVGGQQTFVLRTRGRQHEGELHRESTWPGWDQLLRIAAETGDELIAIAESVAPGAEVDLPYAGKAYRFPVRFFLIHAAEHSIEHRTEIKIALAQMGVETPDLDAWAYAGAMGYGAETGRRLETED
jgi:uncharacterized damage-inducible protein DinB